MDEESNELTADQLARIAYDAYGNVTGHVNLPGMQYDDLTDIVKAAWEAAALAIWDVYLSESDSES